MKLPNVRHRGNLKGEGEDEESNPIIEKQPDEERVVANEDCAPARKVEQYVPPQDVLAPGGAQPGGGLDFEGQAEIKPVEDGRESETDLPSE